MSLTAVQWAWRQRPGKASRKLLLVALADRADADHECFPSVMRLVRDTELDRKTVLYGLRDLQRMGLLEDTGRRVGRTGQVRVYRLRCGEHEKGQAAQKRGSSRVPKTGRFPSRNGSDFPAKTVSLLPGKPVQKRHPEPPRGTQRRNRSEQGCAPERPDWLDPEVWSDYLSHRKQKKAPLTPTAWRRMEGELLELQQTDNIDPNDALAEAMAAGWQGFKAHWLRRRQAEPVGGTEAVRRRRSAAEAFR